MTRSLTIFCVLFCTVSALSVQTPQDSTQLKRTTPETNLYQSSWLQWGEWLENNADLHFITTGLLGAPTAIQSRSSSVSSPMINWKNLPLLDVCTGRSDPSLLPADAISSLSFEATGIAVDTREYLGGKPQSRFHYRTLDDLSDLDITQRMAFSSRFSITVGGFQQRMKPKDPYGNVNNGQEVDRGLLSLNYRISQRWAVDYHLLRNRARIDTVQRWFQPQSSFIMDAPMYRRLRYDHRLGLSRKGEHWTTTLNLGHSTDRQRWIDTQMDTTATQRSGDTQIKLTHVKTDSTGGIAFGLWSVFRRLDYGNDHDDKHSDSWHRAFFSHSRTWRQWRFKTHLALQHASSWGQWEWLANTELKRSVHRHFDIKLRWQRDVRAHALGTRSFNNNTLYAGVYYDAYADRPALIAQYGKNGFDTCQNGHKFNLDLRVQASGFTAMLSPFYTTRNATLQPVVHNDIASLALTDVTLRGLNGYFAYHWPDWAAIDGGFSWIANGEKTRLGHADWSGHARLFFHQMLFAPDMDLTAMLQLKFWSNYDILLLSSESAQRATQSADFTLDAKISTGLLRQGWLGFSVDNILDKTIYTVTSMPQRGRTLRLEFIWELFD